MPDQDLVAIPSQQQPDWEQFAELIRGVHDARAAGELDARCDVESLHGAPRDAADLVNAMLERDTSMVREAADLAYAWAGGDFQATMQQLPGKASEVNDKLESLRTSLQEIASQMAALRQAALRGELSARADSGALQGEFLSMVQGMNETLDSIINPMNLASAYLESISQGEIPPKITESYTGDFEGVKRSINGCIDAVGGLLADTTSLAEAAVAGRLGSRADASRHVGDFRRIIEGFNQTLDALLAPIREAALVLETLSHRNLSARVAGDFPGEHARIKNAVNQTAEALDVALRQVSEAVDQISSASSQIADGSQSVAQGASEQASALEQTSSSMEQMSGMTQQNAENTEQARVLADTTRQAADKGVRAMAQMVESIGKIRTSSEGTAVIIRDINDIAFQTNLLALNAAVEAARAGDAGRGFAVVAGEVRSLAQRAKEAANKTNELIGQSVRLTEEGQKVSQQVDAGLREIQDSALKVAGIVGEIAAASREQSKGIHQVNKALAEMDKITQQNAANSEQSSSAAEELASQAHALAAILAEFQLSHGASSATQEADEPAARRLHRPTQPGSNGGAKRARNGGRPTLS